MTTTVSVRPITEGDLPALEASHPFGKPGKHVERLSSQQAGDTTYLIAWFEGVPVGHVLVDWRGMKEEPVASSFPGVPKVEDLLVHPQYRRRGIGTRLMDAAEQEAKQRGHDTIGLGVDVENTGAREFYRERGYRDSGFAPFRTSWSWLTREGQPQRWEETDIYLMKSLPSV